jgi:hypothetical protein
MVLVFIYTSIRELRDPKDLTRPEESLLNGKLHFGHFELKYFVVVRPKAIWSQMKRPDGKIELDGQILMPSPCRKYFNGLHSHFISVPFINNDHNSFLMKRIFALPSFSFALFPHPSCVLNCEGNFSGNIMPPENISF